MRRLGYQVVDLVVAALAGLCRAEGLWFHVDGAFGAPAILSAGGRELLAGIEQADSLALDAHKWLFQPLEAGCVLVRDVGLLESIFSTHREFLLDAAAGHREVNFTDRGLQLTRSFRAFKLWLSLKVFGLDAFAAAVQHGMDLAGYADALLRRRPGWEDVEATLARVEELARSGWGSRPGVGDPPLIGRSPEAVGLEQRRDLEVARGGTPSDLLALPRRRRRP